MYTPSEYPKKAFILISAIVAVGIIGTIFSSIFFAVFALVFWIQYTMVLSYRQWRKKRKHKIKNFTTFLLNPQLRFAVFLAVALMGLFSLFYKGPSVAYIALFAWWLFSLNFYRHYREFGE